MPRTVIDRADDFFGISGEPTTVYYATAATAARVAAQMDAADLATGDNPSVAEEDAQDAAIAAADATADAAAAAATAADAAADAAAAAAATAQDTAEDAVTAAAAAQTTANNAATAAGTAQDAAEDAAAAAAGAVKFVRCKRGVAAAGPVAFVGAQVGDTVAATRFSTVDDGVVEELAIAFDDDDAFEATVTVVDQIQQIAATDFSLTDFLFVITRP
jgi:hypothetical protein